MKNAVWGSVLLGLGALGMVAGCSGTDPAGGSDDAGTTNASEDAGVTPPPPACGRITTLCKVGDHCEGAPDCDTGICRDGTCRESAPDNGKIDGDESDVDCGGSNAPACADGKACNLGSDCQSSVCVGNVCKPARPDDGVKNGSETDVDCGGASANPRCAQGKACAATSDCAAALCTNNACAAPSTTDGIENGGETGIDCGGTATTKCPTGQGCAVTADCDKAKCNAQTNVCDPPSATDQILNGTETDVDCGGANAPKCAADKACVANGDCASDGCGTDGKCALAPSCAPLNGGRTCGKGEVDDPNKVHESCCASIPLPANPTVKIDKYEITAGRMREFIRRTGGNVRAWVDAHRNITSQIPDAMLPYLPESNTQPVRTIMRCNPDGSGCAQQSVPFGIYGHLGNGTFMPDRPCTNCGNGCFVNTSTGAFGHFTYWQDKATSEAQFGSERDFDQATLDVKSLNCTTQVLLAAFCAWDGGRLPTQAELGGVNGAWGPNAYPWTADKNVAPESVWDMAGEPITPPASGSTGRQQYYAYDNNGNPTGVLDANAWLVRMIELDASVRRNAPDRNVTNWNPFGWSVPEARYVFPARPFAKWDSADQAFAVAAPGRMVHDRRTTGAGTLDGYFDIGGNIMEATADVTGFDDANHNGWPQTYWVGGSFEGHGVNNRGGYGLSVLTKYGKQGGRCAR